MVMYGEGLDRGDKAINKAMSSAYKNLCFQLFCIPVEPNQDSEFESPQVNPMTIRDHKDLDKLIGIGISAEAFKKVICLPIDKFDEVCQKAQEAQVKKTETTEVLGEDPARATNHSGDFLDQHPEWNEVREAIEHYHLEKQCRDQFNGEAGSLPIAAFDNLKKFVESKIVAINSRPENMG